MRLEHEPARIQKAGLVEMARTRQECQPSRPVRLAHAGRRRADRNARHRVHEEQLLGPVAEDDDDLVAALERDQPAEDHGYTWKARMTFDDRITGGPGHRAA